MNIFLYASGLIIGIVSFLYIGSFLRDTTEVITQKKLLAKQKAKDEEDRKHFFENLPINKIKPGLRICPFCREELSRDEPLYASRVLDNDESKLLIHGCRFCYKPEKTINL
jgi:hypothetical protein